MALTRFDLELDRFYCVQLQVIEPFGSQTVGSQSASHNAGRQPSSYGLLEVKPAAGARS